MKKDNYIFPAIFNYDDDVISIEFPNVPRCLSCAEIEVCLAAYRTGYNNRAVKNPDNSGMAK